MTGSQQFTLSIEERIDVIADTILEAIIVEMREEKDGN